MSDVSVRALPPLLYWHLTSDIYSHLIQIDKIRATLEMSLSALFSCSPRSRKREVCWRVVRLWDSDFPEAESKDCAVRRL